ncbi:hypothetical protein [Nocardioides euryhalodurans]|uniref:Lipoprotein n=1 Tax=Nocardioides euryhalodurans TaxID=2518370 RepID=A0A4P7GLS6_9ACTN|nr:hypothetical protein [Nocardioides euryhalodurans]QBR92687.1 hypothetical protein EXE57_10675 [Nocardioides euryhalodurans]
MRTVASPLARRLLIGGVLVLLSACAPELSSLQDDPMATGTLAGMEEVDRNEDRGSSGGMLGKPEPAKVLRIFEIPPDEDPAEVLAEALVTAEDRGWQVRSDNATGFVAERDLDDRLATLIVSLNDDADLGPAPGLYVSLRMSVD